MSDAIVSAQAQEGWDWRGLPNIEVEIRTACGSVGRSIAPASASTGRREAIELRHGTGRLRGRGARSAVARVHDPVSPALTGLDAPIRPPSTRSSMNSTSIHGAHTSGARPPRRSPCPWRTRPTHQMETCSASTSPRAASTSRPQIHIVGGGAHAAHRSPVQDFMAYPVAAQTIRQSLTDVAETYLAVGDILRQRSLPRVVADKRGHWPEVVDTRDALEIITYGIELAGYRPGAISPSPSRRPSSSPPMSIVSAATSSTRRKRSTSSVGFAASSRSPRARTRRVRTTPPAWPSPFGSWEP